MEARDKIAGQRMAEKIAMLVFKRRRLYSDKMRPRERLLKSKMASTWTWKETIYLSNSN
jgi:hypothetical protein